MGGGFFFETLGSHQMKGFAQPFEIFELRTAELQSQPIGGSVAWSLKLADRTVRSVVS